MRKFSAAAVKPLTNWAQAIGVTSAPTTTSTSYVPLPDMSLTLKTSGNPVFITFDALVTNNTVGQTTDFFIYVNGLQIPNLRQAMPAASGYRSVVSFAMIQPLAAGFHKIDVYWSVSAGTGTAIGTNRTLTAREL